MAMIYCYDCGKKISDKAASCPHCGAMAKGGVCNNRALVALLLALILGIFGAHRFYVGKTGTAVTMLILSFTFFGMAITGIWALIDIIMIICGTFTDAKGQKLKL